MLKRLIVPVLLYSLPVLADDLVLDSTLDDPDLAEVDALLAEIDSMDGSQTMGREVSTYVVAGSFRQRDTASAHEQALQITDFQTSIRQAVVGEALYYRVLVGPIPAGREQAVLDTLRASGIAGPWIFQENVTQPTSRPGTDRGTDPALRQARASEVPVLTGQVAAPVARAGSDYHAARLDTAPWRWPDPRK